MKRFNLLLFLLPMLAACTRSDYSRRLAAVDSLLYVRPDSALTLLRSIPPARLHTEEERMRYALFSVEAECRNRIPQRNDSLMVACPCILLPRTCKQELQPSRRSVGLFPAKCKICS